MLKKYTYPLLVFTPAIILLIWLGIILCQIYGGNKVNVRIQGYDPRDLLSGRYIRYTLDWKNTDCTQFADNLCPENEFSKYKLTYGRYYVPENLAKPLEKALADRNNKAELIFSYQKGKQPFILSLSVNGKEWKKSLLQ